MANVQLSYGNGLNELYTDMGDGTYARRLLVANPPATAAPLAVGQYKLTASAVVISGSVALQNGVTIKARTTNAGKVFIGGASVTLTDDGTGNGFALEPGGTVSIAVANLNQLYAIGTANDVIYFMGN